MKYLSTDYSFVIESKILKYLIFALFVYLLDENIFRLPLFCIFLNDQLEKAF